MVYIEIANSVWSVQCMEISINEDLVIRVIMKNCLVFFGQIIRRVKEFMLNVIKYCI